ncbi:hypothetical protein [Demequina rhizosphaerae]|uniref:hypothetical protein n=1 Tax=Demequina rhizosphaerae TaxID=1638985 RepID=UPI0007825813|nr:hypothetical protein [Demequina rhizosphaerae]
MTDTTETTAEAATEVAVDTAEAAVDDKSKAGRDAAKYRRQLRETEGERDTLREHLTAMRRAEVERIATGADMLADGADLWQHADLDALLAEDGTVDAEAVQASVLELVKAKPHYRGRRFAGSADSGVKASEPQAPAPTWSDALRGK